jgi:hypothetical protein
VGNTAAGLALLLVLGRSLRTTECGGFEPSLTSNHRLGGESLHSLLEFSLAALLRAAQAARAGNRDLHALAHPPALHVIELLAGKPLPATHDTNPRRRPGGTVLELLLSLYKSLFSLFATDASALPCLLSKISRPQLLVLSTRK